jgi:hypothetical protein
MIAALRRRVQWRPSSLWTLIIPPTVWALHFLLCYVYVAIRCAKGGPLTPLDDVRIVIAATTLVALMIVAVSGWIAWTQMSVEGDPPPHDASTVEDQHRFLATAKLLLAGLSFVAIIYTAIPAFILTDCR